MHTPMRMCIACRKMQPQSELIRIVRENGTNEIKLDRDKKLMGRGAYICGNEECIGKAAKKNGLKRHFGCTVPSEIYESLRDSEKG